MCQTQRNIASGFIDAAHHDDARWSPCAGAL